MRDLKPLIARNLGPKHPFYNKMDTSGYTQVIVTNEGNIIAQFYGPYAKITASNFIDNY